MKKCGIVQKVTLTFVLNVKRYRCDLLNENWYYRSFVYGMLNEKYTLYVQNPTDISKITFNDWDELFDFMEEEEERLLAGGFVKE